MAAIPSVDELAHRLAERLLARALQERLATRAPIAGQDPDAARALLHPHGRR